MILKLVPKATGSTGVNISQRLDQGTVVIMDGGTGTEIQRRGVAMDSSVWSGVAHMVDPDATREVHEDYIRSGAEVVIANTFAAAQHVLDSKGLGTEFESINRRAVELAIEAREQVAASPVWVAGSISSMTPLTALGQTARGQDLESDYRRQAEVMAAAGVDLIIAEMMLDHDGTLPVVRAARSVGLPLWVGFSATVTPKGRIIGFQPPRFESIEADDFADVVGAGLSAGCDVAGVMHSVVGDTGPALALLAEQWTGPLMAYAETGAFEPPTWRFEEGDPVGYAGAAASWVTEHGVQVIGGCCGTGPDYIRALHDRLAGATVGIP